jgi:transcriptional regulator with XRE-family HTH domain/tetratricopeptide (TPR) repeat protein
MAGRTWVSELLPSPLAVGHSPRLLARTEAEEARADVNHETLRLTIMTDQVPRPRLRRRRVALGWSQERAADEVSKRYPHIGIDARQIGRWETGKTQTPRLVNIWAVSKTYGLPPEQLDFPPMSDTDFASFDVPAASSSAVGSSVTAEPVGAHPPADLVDSDDVKRREFARLLALTGAAAGGLDLERWASVLAGTRVDEPALRDMETLTAELVRREATMAPHALMPTVRGHLQGVRDMLVWTPSNLAPRAYSLAGQTAFLAGYLMLKQERRGEADAYWSLAERFGDMAGDGRLRAAVLLLGRAQLHGENSSQALSDLDRAESLLGPTPEPTVAALVLSARAPQHAEASQLDSTHTILAMRDMDNADAYLSRMSSVEGDQAFYVWERVKGTAMELRTEALLHLDRAKESAAEFQRLLASIDPEWLSWRSRVTIRLAATHAKMGDPEQASELLSASLRLAADASVPRLIKIVCDTQRRWLPAYDGPAARRLDEQLRAISPPLGRLPGRTAQIAPTQ